MFYKEKGQCVVPLCPARRKPIITEN